MNTPESNNARTVTRNDIAATRCAAMRHRIIELRQQVDRQHTTIVFYRALSIGLACALVVAGIFL